eukprot:scaffold25006_cov64-Phaeocystis_antarctica.AAC.6
MCGWSSRARASASRSTRGAWSCVTRARRTRVRSRTRPAWDPVCQPGVRALCGRVCSSGVGALCGWGLPSWG